MLVIVEGEKTDDRLMNHLFQVYGMNAKYQIVSYGTNIYVLYNEMFHDGRPEDMDILQVLKAREKDERKKQIFEQDYTDIMLVFDLDPQDGQFSDDKISAMMDYFIESTDMGKLYINYPMIDAFYHMSSIPDSGYNDRVVAMDELRNKTYKSRVNAENRNRDYKKFAVTRDECSAVIRQNIEKGKRILVESDNALADARLILKKQLEELSQRERMYVLCTCVYFVAEYNSALLEH